MLLPPAECMKQVQTIHKEATVSEMVVFRPDQIENVVTSHNLSILAIGRVQHAWVSTAAMCNDRFL